MTDTSIFNGAVPTAKPEVEVVASQEGQPVVAAPDYSAILAQITNEQGSPKYSDIDTALQSIPHAQKHISTLEADNARLQEELQKRATAEELLEKFQTKPAATQQNAEPLDANKIAQIVEQVVGNKEKQSIATANQAKVVAALTTKFGDSAVAEKQYLEVGAKYGLGPSTLNDLAAKSPEAVLALFGTSTQASPTLSRGSVNTEAFRPNSAGDVDMGVIKRAAGPCTTKDGINAWREAGKLVNKS